MNESTSNNEPRVELREVTAESLAAILALEVAESQRRFVASNAKSIAEAHFHPEAWFRAIYADEQPVGFVMLHDESLHPAPRQQGFYFLWRLMIDKGHQGRGYGRRTMELLIDHVRTRPDAKELLASCVPGSDSPQGFYLQIGFHPTGNHVHGEVELRFVL